MTDYEFWSRVDKQIASPCWIWQGATSQGYGRTRFEGKPWFAHRLAYMLTWSGIPDGMTLDHLCCNPLCVYPWHLEPVSSVENSRRKDIRRRTEKLQRKACARSDQRRAAWYTQWLHSFKPVYTDVPLSSPP